MSKGLGKLQREIMAELDKRECFYLHELLGETCTPARRSAMYRAAWRLCGVGAINIFNYATGSYSIGEWHVAIARRGISVERVHRIDYGHQLVPVISVEYRSS